ncbi:MAG TPA: flagellin [Fimbriimonas sp.]|nr:flagellin [Fimbriimonas sp.]
MSFSINTNLLAMNAINNLNSVSGRLGESMTRLSTGLRINTAADDPAGLIASQNMTAQIGGMSQAITNSQEGINYVKTADGALGQVNTLLNSAYSLAVAASNSATLSPTEVQADQQQLNSIVSSITTISQTTTYGAKHLLDGTSGVQSSTTDGANISSLNIGGTVKGAALTANATVTLNSLTAATQATDTSTAFASTTAAVATAGSFTLNGVTFTATATTTAGDLINAMNNSSQQTGVVASYESGAIKLSSTAYGSNAKIDLVDASGVFRGSAGADSSTGADATASIDVGTSATGVLFTGSLNGNGGLTLSDADGNSFTLTAGGNTAVSSAKAIGQVIVGSAQFQIGATSGQTASLSIGNFAASQLGTGAVSGKNMSNLDISTTTGAADAMKVITAAINQVSSARGAIGNFQTNVLQQSVNSLTTAQQNLSASLSTVQDTNIAQEMTNFTKLQILEQSGMSILSQANQLPQQVLSLIRG